jgi:cell division protein FtsI (penicillin-binding protein 3)
MQDPGDDPPPADSPPLNGHGRPARRRGAARADTVPLMETVRLTAPDIDRRAALEMIRGRLVITAFLFCALFVALLAKLTDATVLQPMLPTRPDHQIVSLPPPVQPAADISMPGQRAMITDRNGEILAVSLPTVSLFADPRQIIDPAAAAKKLKSVLPRLDEAMAIRRLSQSTKGFVYLERQITPDEEVNINALGIPGIDFQPTEERHYPMGRLAAQVLGGVDVDEHGVAGVEKYFNKRLEADRDPLRLSLDIRIEGIVRDELATAMAEFQAVGACGIVMDARTGEVLAMVSLPDYNANEFGSAPADARFNRAVTGMYEPGSMFKLQTASMALNDGVIHIWDEFDAARDIHIGRYTITDFEGKHRWLYLPEVIAYSSNLGAAHIALDVGAARQRAWLRMMGMFSRVPIQLPEAALPIVQSAAQWKEATTMTVGFGQGISVSPLHVVRGTAAVATGWLVRPTLVAMPPLAPGQEPPGAVQVVTPETVTIMHKLMRLVVTSGFGEKAEVPGYYAGGKTGTSETVGRHGYRRGFKEDFNVSAFVCAFPMNDPRYVVYVMLDEPHGNKSTYGFSTAGWVSAPTAGKVIARMAPMMGMLPDTKDAPEINQALYIPLQPARPPGAPALPVGVPFPEVQGAEWHIRAGYRGPVGKPLPPSVARPAPRGAHREASRAPAAEMAAR